jgi:hypothetical protein
MVPPDDSEHMAPTQHKVPVTIASSEQVPRTASRLARWAALTTTPEASDFSRASVYDPGDIDRHGVGTATAEVIVAGVRAHMTTGCPHHDPRQVLRIEGETIDYRLLRCGTCGDSRLEWSDGRDSLWAEAPDDARTWVLDEVRRLLRG